MQTSEKLVEGLEEILPQVLLVSKANEEWEAPPEWNTEQLSLLLSRGIIAQVGRVWKQIGMKEATPGHLVPHMGDVITYRVLVPRALERWASDNPELAALPLVEVESDLIDFAQERGGFEGFWRNVFTDIQGNDALKKALTIALFSAFGEPVHIIALGDPGSSKTLARDIIVANFEGVTKIGSNATRAGLVMHRGTGKPGVLANAHRKVVVADEFDKIDPADVENCYELLSNGKCSVHSAKVDVEIESDFIMIAFGNPKSQVFGEDPISDIGLSPILMSRFALVVRTENLSTTDRLTLFRSKLGGTGDIQRMPEKYDQWVRQGREGQPQWEASDERLERYLAAGDDIFKRFKDTNLRRDLRMGDYLRRIPMAIARASFTAVTDEVIDIAEQVLEEVHSQW